MRKQALIGAIAGSLGVLAVAVSPVPPSVSVAVVDPNCADLQIIAHRGYHIGPDVQIHSNTLLAFTEAANRGWDVETDVRADADGVLWIMHDANVLRDTGVDAAIARMSTDEVRALRTRTTNQPLPTLEEALVGVRDASPSARIYVEVKLTSTTSGVSRLIRETGMIDRAFVTSKTDRMHATEPDINLVLKSYQSLPDPAVLHSAGVSIIALLDTQITAAVVDIYHDAGIEVQSGRANGSGKWRTIIAAGADGILTDETDALERFCGAAARPAITSFAPGSGTVGEAIAITGTGFGATSAVKFGAVEATFTVDSASRVTAVVPAGVPASSKIQIVTSSGSALSSTPFKVPPTITGFAPQQASAGSTVGIEGTALSAATIVRFGTIDASFRAVSNDHIDAVVPGALPNQVRIRVSTPGGSVLSTGYFTTVGP